MFQKDIFAVQKHQRSELGAALTHVANRWKLRNFIRKGKSSNKVQFIGGLQELNINQTLEYWPFEGEYWEDELGFYVYNLDSKCSYGKKKKKKKKQGRLNDKTNCTAFVLNFYS